MAEEFRLAAVEEGIASVASKTDAAIVGFRVHGPRGEVWPTVLAKLDGEWKYDTASLAGAFEAARAGVDRAPPAPTAIHRLLEEVSPRIREALRAAHRIGGAHGDGPITQALRRRLQSLARRMAHRRETLSLAAIDLGIRFLARGRTAGEEARIAAWMELPDRELLERLRALVPEEPARAPAAVSLIGVIVLGPARSFAPN